MKTPKLAKRGNVKILIRRSTPLVWSFSPTIQSLRAISVSLVVLEHAGWVPKTQKLGSIGVALFFVISGFVITGLLCQKHAESSDPRIHFRISQFYIQRAKRLIPLSYLVAILVVSTHLLFIKEDNFHYLTSLLFIIFYVPNLFSGEWFYGYSDLPNPLGHYWSLGVEEQFYFVWPLLLFWILKKSTYNQIKIIVNLILVFVFAHWIPPLLGIGGQSLPTTYVDLLLTGALIALLRRNFYFKQTMPKNLAILCLFGFFSILLFFPTEMIFFHGRYPLPSFYVFQLILVSGIFLLSLRISINFRVLQFVGNISYGIYLIHKPLLYFAEKYFIDSQVVIAGTIGASIGFAWISFKYFESRIHKKSY